MSKKVLRVIPLGGLGEVGKNMTLYEYGEEILIVDVGLMFPDNDMVGIDYIIPDFAYLKGKEKRVRGIVFTHGHEDHTGAIQHLLETVDAPIYATALTRGLLEVKLARYGLLNKARLNTVKAGESIQIASFKIDFFHVCHSIPDCVGLGIDTPAGLIVHSGDYKFDHTPVDNWPSDYSRLAEFERRGVLALLADSTNAEHPGWTPSERVIDKALDHVFAEAKGRILVATFASLISRLQQVAVAAAKHGRKIAFVGTSMVENVKMARALGYIGFEENLVVSIDQALGMPDHLVAIICTGSQGEPTSILGRLARGTNRRFDIKKGDTVIISSHPIPGNEEMVYRVLNKLIQRGAELVYEAIAPVHVSGHASQEEIKLLMHLVRPKYFIPVHGELRMLKRHAQLAAEIGIPESNIALVENGQIIEFKDGKMRLGERIPGGYVFVDGSGVGDVDKSVMREREMLGEDGVVMISFSINRARGCLNGKAQILMRGFMQANESADLLDELQQLLAKAVADNPKIEVEALEKAVKSHIYSETRRKPVLFLAMH